MLNIIKKHHLETNNAEIICCPKCKQSLHFREQEKASSKLSGIWKCQPCGIEYPDSEGIIEFIRDEEVFRSSRREAIIRSIYARMYTQLTNLMFLLCGGARNARIEVLNNLEMHPRAIVLETGVGPGDNIPFLSSMIDGCPFYGLDNQLIMLRKCARNSKKWNQPVRLYRANAEELPFKDNFFDVVFHVGAINLFENKKKAIDEMIRVAKPGTRIVIADETEKASKLFALFVGCHEPVVAPIDLVPESMLEISLKNIWNDYGYLISFRKPGN
jgi:ubiquinone/menaquinone biosynthesis C-methylase UbiE/ribosomal protein L37AE/L43A